MLVSTEEYVLSYRFGVTFAVPALTLVRLE
jgi:hypothetical protein